MSHLKVGETENRLHNNGEPPPSSNVDVQSEAVKVSATKPSSKQHLEEKNGKRKNDMTLEEMYNSQYDLEDDEDDDSDWEPSALPDHSVVEIPKWFCLNCTMVNIGDDFHCNLCGEHRKSGIVKRGHFASPFRGVEDLTENDVDAADGLQDPVLQNIASDNRTAIGFDERMLLHEEVVMKSHPHPERPDRLRAIAASLAAAGIFPGKCYPIPAREVTQDELLKVHSLENIEAVEVTSRILSSYFTPDTYANQHSACAARLAAGLCFDLAAAIYSGSAKNGFALVRPPGHHAGVKHAMGFCLHNNAAVAASAAQIAGAKKVLIIDWDVHHGNGTQEIFENNKSVLYISLHRHERGRFYPGTGSAYEVGVMGAEGYCVNVPWSCGGVGDNDYVFAFQQVVIPIASAFNPDFTIISAGFDAARGDPLGGCDVTPTGYAQMTEMCSALSGGKLLVILEGGYNLRSISSSATAVIKVLLGETPKHNVDQVFPSKAGVRTVLDVLKIQTQYWPSLELKLSKLESEWGWYARQDKGKKVDLSSVRNYIMRHEKGGLSSGRGRKDKGKGKVGSSRTTAGDLDVVMGMPTRAAPRRGVAPRVPSKASEGGAASKCARDYTSVSLSGSTRGRGKGLFCYGAKESLGYDSHWDTINSAYSLKSMQGVANEHDLGFLQKYDDNALLEFHAGDLARAFNLALTLC